MKENDKNNRVLNIRDIAKMAGVSPSTVSRVINNSAKISEKTRAKVERIIKEYKYVPNEEIKNIFQKESHTIAIFIAEIINPFYTNLIIELNNLCFRDRSTLLICDTENDIEKERSSLEFCLAKRCKGIILTEGVSNDVYTDSGINIVRLDRDANERIPHVTSENYYSVRKLVNYLYRLGHRDIAFVGPQKGIITTDNRFNGYRDELIARGIDIIDDYIVQDGTFLNPRHGKKAMQHFLSLKKTPTAIVCANDMIALGVMNEATSMGINVPEELSVTGFDYVLKDFMPRQLTTIQQDIPLMAQKLYEFIQNPPKTGESVVLDTTFIHGQSCAAPQI